MKYNTKKDVIVTYKRGQLAKWELKPILEEIEFRENVSRIAEMITWAE